MNIYYARFLANTNIKGNSKSKILITLVAILVISVTVFTSYGVIITSGVNEFKQNYMARSVEISAFKKGLDEKTIESIKKLDHVYNVYDCMPFTSEYFDIRSIDGKAVTSEMFFDAYPLIGDEKRNVIAGKTLDESPEYSCIIPSYFHPYEDGKYSGEDINPEDLIGKTISVKPGINGKEFELLCDYYDEYGVTNEFFHLPPLKFNLKVVGVYYVSPSTYFDTTQVYLSRKTAMDMTEKELKAGNIDLSSKTDPISVWWNTPSIRSHYLILDDYDSFQEVYNKVSEMGVDCSEMRQIEIHEDIPIMASILSFASVVISACIFIVCIFIFIQSNVDFMIKRKGELGLLKAMGYKNRDIMKSLIYEYLSLSIKGFLIGGILSTSFVAVMNFVFYNRNYAYRMYIVDWRMFAGLMVISLIIAVIVPFICQLIMLRKLSKITPKDAMSSN